MSILDPVQAAPSEPGEPPFFSAQIARAARFHFDLDPPRRSALAVVCGGREECAADYRVSRPTFPYPTVEVIVAGHGELTLGGRAHRLRPGSVFAYGPGVGHAFRSDARPRLVKYFVSFAGRRADGLLRDCGLSPGVVTHTLAADAVGRLVEEMIDTAARHTARGPALCALVLEQALLRLAESAVPAAAVEGRAFQTYRRCRRFMVEHHRRVADLDAVARGCGVDASYLCRLFQRYHDRSPYQFLTRLRMAAAAELLVQPPPAGRLVKDVAAELGFADPFLFSRAFKQVYGVSPRAFQLCRAP